MPGGVEGDPLVTLAAPIPIPVPDRPKKKTAIDTDAGFFVFFFSLQLIGVDFVNES